MVARGGSAPLEAGANHRHISGLSQHRDGIVPCLDLIHLPQQHPLVHHDSPVGGGQVPAGPRGEALLARWRALESRHEKEA